MTALAKHKRNLDRLEVGSERIEHLRTLGFSSDELYRIVAPRRTLARRVQSGTSLSLTESDRVARIERIVEHAMRVFRDAEKVNRWLRKESRALDNSRPIDLLESETGAHLVGQELIRIDYGMLS